jgi:adenine-specific DNA-methyltransferase
MTMATHRRAPAGPTDIDAVTHKDKRINLPTADARDFITDDLRAPIPLRYPRDTTLDPQLVWTGKDQQDAEDLVVDAPPLYIQEKLDPRVLIENLRRTAARPQDEPELTLFDNFDGVEGWQTIEYYKHPANWSNRMILGDSLQVMASLAERESLRGQVQMIYIDPPYGIKFGSNWQPSTNRIDVRDRPEDATREVEQIKAFRDTWELGINSYLAYLRDRLVTARDLLTETGSVFAQIGDENIHLVRALLDEVFGRDNFVAQIQFKTTSGATSEFVGGTVDFVLWYAKRRESTKFRRLYRMRLVGQTGDQTYSFVEWPDGTRGRLTKAELATHIEGEGRLFRLQLLTSQSQGRTKGEGAASWFPVEIDGKEYRPSMQARWKTNEAGMARLVAANRVQASGNTINYVRFHDDFPAIPLNNLWDDTQSGSALNKVYVVQTNTKIIERCMLMSSDPGDLVLDPTCGSGSTATVAEQWGRRWITIDTSRVALTLARQRIMGAKYQHYLLADSPEGIMKEAELTATPRSAAPTNNDIRKGFVYRRVPHVTLKSIVNNPDIKEGMTREQIDRAIAKHAETELLYDQPYEDPRKVRVAGPFTVESPLPYRALGDDGVASASEAASEQDTTTNFEQMLLDNLQKAGVQNGRKAERFEFEEIERVPGKYLTGRAAPSGHLADERVAISIGPRYGTVGADWIKAAAREAMRGQGHDVLLVLGFAFDPYALETVEEFRPDGDRAFVVQAEHQAGTIRILLVRMNADLAMGESLLKKTKAANLFTVFGEPDIAPPQWTEQGWVVTIRGFDVYNPLTGEVRAGDEQDIAMWMIDTDYNEESFFVRHAYFLGANPYERLKKALKADINADDWDSLNSATSRPFPHPAAGKIAVKVINHYGDELLSVLDLPDPGVS